MSRLLSTRRLALRMHGEAIGNRAQFQMTCALVRRTRIKTASRTKRRRMARTFPIRRVKEEITKYALIWTSMKMRISLDHYLYLKDLSKKHSTRCAHASELLWTSMRTQNSATSTSNKIISNLNSIKHWRRIAKSRPKMSSPTIAATEAQSCSTWTRKRLKKSSQRPKSR